MTVGCSDFTGSWHNSAGDFEMYIHDTCSGPIDFIVAGDTTRFGILYSGTSNDYTYLTLESIDIEYTGDNFYVLEYSDDRPNLIIARSYAGSSVNYQLFGEERELIFTVRFTR